MSQMPLNDRDFAEVRGNVLREIARRQRRNAMFFAGSVAFAVLAIVFVLIPRPQPHSAGEAAGAPLRTPPPVAQQLSGAPAASPVQTVVATQTEPRHHRKRHHHPEPIAIASAEQQTPITIELQTANPDVRIIWIAK